MKLRLIALSFFGHVAVIGAVWVARPLCVTPTAQKPEPIFFELVEEESPEAERAPETEPVPEPKPVPEPLPEAQQETVESPPAPVPRFQPESEPLPDSPAAEIAAEPPAPAPEPKSVPEPPRAVEASAPAEGAVERAKVVSAPQALNRIAPAYPRSARRRRREGVVIVEAVVRESGAVEAAEVVSSSGFGDLDGAAVKAVRTAAFVPAKEDGVTVSGRIRLTFEFRLKAAASSP